MGLPQATPKAFVPSRQQTIYETTLKIMFKYLIIWNILGVIIIGTESKAVTKSCYDFGYDIPYEPTGREKIGDYRRPFYRLILKCAEDVANEMMPENGLKKNCMKLDMVDYCANLYTPLES